MDKNKKNISVFLLTCSVFFLFILFFINLLINPIGNQRSIFFAGTNDFFADFFNVLRYISGRDPYYNTINGLGEKIYLPVSYLLLYPFSKFDNFGYMTLQESQASHMGILSLIFFTILSMFLFYHGLKELCKKFHVEKYIVLSFFLSYPLFFSIERGNLIILSASAVFYYISYYDSTDEQKRILACITLAISISLKVYPALFILLLFNKNRYKEFFFCLAVTLLIVFLPFLFFKHGFNNIGQLIKNINISKINYNFTNRYPRFGMPNLAYVISMHFTHSASVCDFIAVFFEKITIVVVFFSVVSALFVKDEFLKITLLTSCVLNLPVNSALYTGLYFFPCIIIYYRNAEKRNLFVNTFFLLLFILFLSPVQICFSHKNLSQYIVQLVSIVVWFIVLFWSYTNIFAERIKRNVV